MIDRKERLFRAQDVTRWGFEGAQDELIRRQAELLKDKDKAFKYMLSKESQDLEYLREELFYYSNQCLGEVRRVGNDNGTLLTDHFITMSQIQCAYINQHHVMWADFLSHFSAIRHFFFWFFGLVSSTTRFTRLYWFVTCFFCLVFLFL